MDSHGYRYERVVWVFCLLLVSVFGCQSDGRNEHWAGGRFTIRSTDVGDLSGRWLAERYCSSCHRFPHPELLNRFTWKETVLPWMGHRLGIYDGDRPDSLFERGIGGKIVRAANVFPQEPVLSRAEWRAIVRFYLDNAPEGSLPEPDSVQLTTGLEGFRLEVPSFRRDPPLTSLLQIGENGNRVYVGDAKASLPTLNVLDRNLKLQRAFALDTPPSSLREDGGRWWVTLIGSIPPTDQPSGSLIRIDPEGGAKGEGSMTTLVDSLKRPVHAAYGDLNADGREDIVISEFGYRTGALSWHERLADGRHRRHVLRPGPGAVRSVIRDFNEDGQPDVMALFGQGREAFYIFYNEGEGRFREERVLEFAPSYGSVYFELTDFNGDSRADILYVNGDNADYTSIMKGYHGLRIFLNDGENGFEQRFFYHLDGAYKAIPRDYDGDGDLDIAAISFFPDYQRSLKGSFVLLEQTGALEFRASTFKESSIGAWLVFDAGDLDRDGDVDLLLGSYAGIGAGSDYVPVRLRKWWIEKGPSLVLLENTFMNK